MGQELAQRIEPAVLAQWNQTEVDILRNVICPGANRDELEFFAKVCDRTKLDPFTKQIYLVKRWNSQAKKEVAQPQTSIDGFRLIAERTGKYAGQVGPYWCGPDGAWKDVWLEKGPPAAAKVGVIRSDFKEPLWAVATWDSYVQTNKDGKPAMMWERMPEVMVSKCAESLALRRAFPNELSGIYTAEEMAQAETPAAEPVRVQERATLPALPPGVTRGMPEKGSDDPRDTPPWKRASSSKAALYELVWSWANHDNKTNCSRDVEKAVRACGYPWDADKREVSCALAFDTALADYERFEDEDRPSFVAWLEVQTENTRRKGGQAAFAAQAKATNGTPQARPAPVTVPDERPMEDLVGELE
jgi:phage recombination protein Bet